MAGGLTRARLGQAIHPDVKTQCSIIGSSLGTRLSPFPTGLAPALTESPLHALQGNGSLPVFFGLFIAASSPRPAFNIINSNGFLNGGLTGDPFQDAMNTDTFCLVHDWGDTITGSSFEEKDTIDPSTFVVTPVMVKDEPDNPTWQAYGNVPQPLRDFALKWPNLPPDTFAAGSNIFNQTATRNTLLNAVRAVDMSKLWSGEQIPVSGPILSSGAFLSGFRFDRFNSVQAARDGAFDGSGGVFQGGVLDGRFKQIAGTGIFPGQMFGGPDTIVQSGVDVGGEISFARAQLQVRNFPGSPLEYNFIEVYGAFRMGPDGVLVGITLYRVGPPGDVFTANDQIADIPIPSITDMPSRITYKGDDYAITGGTTRILVGQSVQEYLTGKGISSDRLI